MSDHVAGDESSGPAHDDFDPDHAEPFLTHQTAEFLLAPEPEESVLVNLERSDCFSWSERLDVVGPGPRLQRSGFLGAPTSDQAWIFDHIPKSGGSEFSAIAERRLYAHDHLYVRFPASWFGVLLGRIERAVLVHGHGARYVQRLAPWRNWRVALCVREPCEAIVSGYQQYARLRMLSGMHEVTLQRYLEPLLANPGPVGLNRQTSWLGLDHVPSIRHARGSVPQTLDLDALTERALERLDAATVVGTPETVDRVFATLARSAELRVRLEGGAHTPANSSAVRSRGLLERLPAEVREGLANATSRDRLIYEHAFAHPGRVF